MAETGDFRRPGKNLRIPPSVLDEEPGGGEGDSGVRAAKTPDLESEKMEVGTERKVRHPS